MEGGGGRNTLEAYIFYATDSLQRSYNVRAQAEKYFSKTYYARLTSHRQTSA